MSAAPKFSSAPGHGERHQRPIQRADDREVEAEAGESGGRREGGLVRKAHEKEEGD